MSAFARQAMDNGADAFVGPRPPPASRNRDLQGKPIFYSLGNFFFMENPQQPTTATSLKKTASILQASTPSEFMEARRAHGIFKNSQWLKSVVAISRYDPKGEVKEIRLHLVELHPWFRSG